MHALGASLTCLCQFAPLHVDVEANRLPIMGGWVLADELLGHASVVLALALLAFALAFARAAGGGLRPHALHLSLQRGHLLTQLVHIVL